MRLVQQKHAGAVRRAGVDMEVVLAAQHVAVGRHQPDVRLFKVGQRHHAQLDRFQQLPTARSLLFAFISVVDSCARIVWRDQVDAIRLLFRE